MATDQDTAAVGSDTASGGLLRPITTWMENLSEEAYAYLLLAPAFFFLFLVAFYPLLDTFRLSFLVQEGRTAEPFYGIGNYVDLLTGEALIRRQVLDIALTSSFPFIEMGAPFFRQALFVTVTFAVVSVVLETAIGFGQALILDKEFRGRRWVRVAIIIPWAIPVVIQAMIFYLFFQPTVGFGTDLMQALGIFGATPLNTSRDSFIIVLVADVWKTSAFMALLILAGLQSVDRSLYDVAEVSGASTWQRFKLITLPLVLPALIVAMLFRTMDAMRIYGVIDATAGCSTVPSLTCVVVDTIFLPQSGVIGLAAAAAFFTAVVIGVFISIYLLFFADSEGGYF